MVKVSSGRESIKCSFREDIGIVSILGRENDIIFLGGDSEFSGQGGFTNVFIVERDSLLYPVDVRVVLC